MRARRDWGAVGGARQATGSGLPDVHRPQLQAVQPDLQGVDVSHATVTADEIEALDQFVARLRAVRIERGLTLRDVAEKTGTAGPTVVGNWETGVRRPRYGLLTA